MLKHFITLFFVGLVATSGFAKPIHLTLGSFDPAIEINNESQFIPGKKLYMLQLKAAITDKTKKIIEDQGVKLGRYIPDHTYIVKINSKAQFIKIQNLVSVNWIGAYFDEFKTLIDLAQLTQTDSNTKNEYNFITNFPYQKKGLLKRLKKLDPKARMTGKMLLTANITHQQLAKIIKSNLVHWVDMNTAIENDVDNARAQGGADYLELQRSQPNQFSGKGIRGHIYEGINPDHDAFQETAFRNKPIAVKGSRYSDHGQKTFGIVFGDGTGRADARGFLPKGQGYYTNNSQMTNRYRLVEELVNEHRVMFQTASWGNQRTRSYTSISAEMDRIIFDFDIPTTQSQSNAGNQDSRPQAWAKNVISIGAVYHGNNADPDDDSWSRGNASIGPAKDGRIKPDLIAYYDNITTTAASGYTNTFGGTSGATPIVAGHVGLALEMWTDGIFNNPLPNPEGDRFDNRPHFTTLKALLINTANQYEFSGIRHDKTRTHQGWGFPSLSNLYNNRENMLVINEDSVLANEQRDSYRVIVKEGSPQLKATLTFADPPGTPASSINRVNNLDLKATSPSGAIYWGNHNLKNANFSETGGSPDAIDTVENIIIANPEVGTWTVEVIATEINQDGHVETEEIDTDYALVVSGIDRQ